MALPFLTTLSAAARLAYPAIHGGVRRGLSANRIQSILTGAGIGIRRQTLLDLVAATRGIIEKGGYLRKLRAGQRFNPAALPQALTRTTREYAITVAVEGTSTDTGLPTWQHITLAMDKPMARDAMEDLAMRLAREGKERYEMTPESAVIEEGVRAGMAGVL